MTQFSDERGAELRELFFETAQEMLQALNDEALKLEKDPSDVETIRNIRRTVHTLKGDAAACGFRELSELAHELEDALALETIAAHASLAELAFAAADAFDSLLACYRSQSPLVSTEPLRKMIRDLVRKLDSAGSSPQTQIAPETAAAAWTEPEKLAIQSALLAGESVFHITAQLDPLCAMPIAARQLILNALASVGKMLGLLPESNSPGAIKRMHLALASAHSAEQIAAKCRIPTVTANVTVAAMTSLVWPAESTLAKTGEAAGAQIHPVETKTASSETQDGDGKTAHGSGSPENILRVDAERVDNVLNLVGELIIGKSMLQQVLNDFTRRYPKDAMRGRFSDALAFQARVLNDLQRSVMKVRMVPVEQLFRRFPRMVRDVAKQCGKEVELVLSGQDTDLDKGLLDAIAEPLTHLVRNAISHGIETAEQRIHAGKPVRGTIRLDAYHQGNQVIIEVVDDGGGIDAAKVKARALQQQVVGPEEAAALTASETLALLFRPGFSTAEEITEISGRGVGLDIVQSVMQRLKGKVDIVTYAGQGTTFRLEMPLTLAIIKALLFRVERRLYAIPLNAVAEIARATESDVHQVNQREVLQLRDQVLQLVRLGRPRVATVNARAKIFVLVIAVGERKLGLIVEALEGEEELVIKAVDDQTVSTNLVSGASILGDGRVVLILNLAAIVERSTKIQSDGSVPALAGLLLSHADQAQQAAEAAGGRA